MIRKTALLAFCIFLCLAFCLPARAQRQGWWRMDADLMAGVYSGTAVDREGDFYLGLTFEYEFPCLKYGTLAFGFMPVFTYVGDVDDVNGGAAGFTYRVYSDRLFQCGWFAGAGSSVLLHNPKFAENSTRMNFLSAFSVGYQWCEGWQAALKTSHISNGDTGQKNAGVNCLGLSVGRRF